MLLPTTTTDTSIKDSMLYMLIVSCFVVFLTITSNYIRFNKKQSEYIQTHPWVINIAVFFTAFTSMELTNPTMDHITFKIILSLVITLIFRIITSESPTVTKL